LHGIGAYHVFVEAHFARRQLKIKPEKKVERVSPAVYVVKYQI